MTNALQKICFGLTALVFLSVLSRQLADPGELDENVLFKAIQVVSASAVSAIFIVHTLIRRFSKKMVFAIVLMASSFLIGLLYMPSWKYFVGIFPTVNTFALSLFLSQAIHQTSATRFFPHSKSFKIFCLAVLTASVYLSLEELWEFVDYFAIYRSTGLIFSPSSSAVLIAFTAYSGFGRLALIALSFFAVFATKSVSSVASLIPSLLFDLRRFSSGARGIILMLTPVFVVLALMYASSFYGRNIFYSISERLRILTEASTTPGGLGYGTNIAQNAFNLDTPISDGTFSLLVHQFGIFGIAWSIMLLGYAMFFAMRVDFLGGILLLIAFSAFNLPEVPFLSVWILFCLGSINDRILSQRGR